MKFIDSHAHLHDSRIYNMLDHIIQRAVNAGVTHMASCATMQNNFAKTLDLSAEYPSVLPFLGVHPWFLETLTRDWKSYLETKLINTRSGIGETGLDFVDKNADRDLQMAVFEYHLDLARQLKRPINIHIRKAWDAFIHLLKKMGPLPVPGVIHSYSGSADMVHIFNSYNLYISFSGSITNPGARKVVQALSDTPEQYIVFETDTPDIYPYIDNPDEKRLNEPCNLPKIATIALKRINRTDIESFCSQVYENSRILFEPILKKKDK